MTDRASARGKRAKRVSSKGTIGYRRPYASMNANGRAPSWDTGRCSRSVAISLLSCLPKPQIQEALRHNRPTQTTVQTPHLQADV